VLLVCPMVSVVPSYPTGVAGTPVAAMAFKSDQAMMSAGVASIAVAVMEIGKIICLTWNSRTRAIWHACTACPPRRQSAGWLPTPPRTHAGQGTGLPAGKPDQVNPLTEHNGSRAGPVPGFEPTD
jgi:hypothetical protein